MVARLKHAFEEAAKLSADQQEAFARFLLAELKDEARWESQFSASQEKLAQIASEARVEFRAGKTRPVDDLLK